MEPAPVGRPLRVKSTFYRLCLAELAHASERQNSTADLAHRPRLVVLRLLDLKQDSYQPLPHVTMNFSNRLIYFLLITYALAKNLYGFGRIGRSGCYGPDYVQCSLVSRETTMSF